MESPGPDLRRRATPGDVQLTAGSGGRPEVPPAGVLARAALPDPDELRAAAAAAAAALVASSSGEVVLLAVLLAAAAGEVLAATVAILATGAVALRWGTTSLDAITGAQSVLGPGAGVGPLEAAASTSCAAAALVLAKAPGWGAIVFGLTAGLAVAGPGPGALDHMALRGAAGVLGAACAAGAQRWAPPAVRPVALGLAAAAVVLAVLA
ncbi:MAG: hypothetical protein ABIS21_01835 [Acidimicrobiales bacterium]